MTTTDHTAENWQIIHHVYDGWVELDGRRLRNIRLPERHFQALLLAARTKLLGGNQSDNHTREDDSLRKAIGNWLNSSEFGAWRNPNGANPYQGNNKQLWKKFVETSRDYSLRQAHSRMSHSTLPTRDPAVVEVSKSTGATKGHFADESDIEGLLTEVVSFKRQRSRKLRDLAFEQANGVCCVCGRDYSKVLGGRGVRVLQVHHRDQLSAREAPSVTTVGDLAVVCANCHLLLHLDSDKALSVDELRKMLRKDGYLPLA